MPTVRAQQRKPDVLRGLPIPQIDDLFPASGEADALGQQAALKAQYRNRLAGVAERWQCAMALVESLIEFFDAWASTYLEQVRDSDSLDHRRVKQRTGPMLGSKRFDTASITISGIELAERSRRFSSDGKTGG